MYALDLSIAICLRCSYSFSVSFNTSLYSHYPFPNLTSGLRTSNSVLYRLKSVMEYLWVPDSVWVISVKTRVFVCMC